ncbi:hypothetical protein BDN72DRAFT_850355 [Pluteus cervinus]|uniref:Uncharacterized protein n=1 Tax=Pluteus cervinus TaxID=181527 RepID=A0ACD3A532_9AGAR|nr:hypothetical protein BDN72DRAFT_850355 [Pluteus cervinus]
MISPVLIGVLFISVSFILFHIYSIAFGFKFKSKASKFFSEHSFRIHSIHLFPFSLGGLSYTCPEFSVSTARVSLLLNFLPGLKKSPEDDETGLVTFIAEDYEYKDNKCHVSILLVRSNIFLSLFPSWNFFKVDIFHWTTSTSTPPKSGTAATDKPSPLLNIKVLLEEFRVRVYSTKDPGTPPWIEMLRNNLLETILEGDHLRWEGWKLDCGVRTWTRGGKKPIRIGELQNDDEVDSASSAPASSGSSRNEEGESDNGDKGPRKQDDVRITGYAKQWHIFNKGNQRMYTFGRLDAQLRRGWMDDVGTYVMVAKESRWTKAPRLLDHEEASLRLSWVQRLGRSISTFRHAVREIWDHPDSVLDLYIPRLDVTFDEFRLRDADLVPRLEGFVKRRLYDGSLLQEFVSQAGWDAIWYLCALEEDMTDGSTGEGRVIDVESNLS